MRHKGVYTHTPKEEIMTKVEAQGITDLMRDLEREYMNAKDEESKAVFLGWIKSIEQLYAKAQKTLARYYK